MGHWKVDELQALFQAWRDGEDMAVLRDRFGRSATAIRQQLSKAGVQRDGKKLSEVRRKARLGDENKSRIV